MKITISKENYLKAIAEAESEGELVIAATLARWLKVSAPAVTMALRRLKRDKLIAVNAEGVITLTPTGKEIAHRLIRRHHLIERMLTEVFGMDWYMVHDEAEQMEHAVSAEFEKKLVEKLGDGEACPHGNFIGLDSPKERRKRGWLPLSELSAGGQANIQSAYERDRELLEYLNTLGIRPGAMVRMVSRNIDDTFTLDLGGKTVPLGNGAAAKVWVAVA
ncbi:metal-dependent transcriptional regulator [Bryobacter aggregatus]|uniref:metal-dependent transcriptional regulator n=1 Tax=Bryobacter aggregatus TaxID=360054 RepID=UPI0004E0F4EE|nr:metal-dependent transcriptional regulator [Bryobacter aggregatus]